MNELSNHDHSRFLTRTNMTVGRLGVNGGEAAAKNINKNIFMSAVVLQMTWTGCPTVYYGDEAGLCGWTDPDDRRPFPWGKEDMNLLELHRELIALRKRYDALKIGSLEYLFNDFGILSYGRWNKNKKIVVIINNNSYNKNISIPVWKIGAEPGEFFERVCLTGNNGFTMRAVNYSVQNGQISVELSAYSSVILADTRRL
jgi:alpha-glucosidase